MSTSPQAEETQTDRDAARKACPLCNASGLGPYGECGHVGLVQAFARHRIAALSARSDQPKALVERVAGGFDPAVHVPGEWRCAKCGFVLCQRNLNANDGTVTTRDDTGDRCPNDGAPLWRRTWKEVAYELGEQLETAALTASGLDEAIEALEGVARYADAYTHVARDEEFVMIPKAHCTFARALTDKLKGRRDD